MSLHPRVTFHEARLADVLLRGALLSDDTNIAAAVGVVSAVLAASLEFVSFRQRRQYSKVQDLSLDSSSDMALRPVEQ